MWNGIFAQNGMSSLSEHGAKGVFLMKSTTSVNLGTCLMAPYFEGFLVTVFACASYILVSIMVWRLSKSISMETPTRMK
jgi:hypothetical protein